MLIQEHIIEPTNILRKATFANKTEDEPAILLPAKSNDFCYEHIINTFGNYPIQICAGAADSSIQCSGAKHSKNMAICKLRGLAMRPKEMIGTFPTDMDRGAMGNFTANLIGSRSCSEGRVEQLENTFTSKDKDKLPSYFVKRIINSPRLEESQCNKWIEKPALLHVSNAVHIYFKFLDLYNLHKAAYDEGLSDGEYTVVRIGNLADNHLQYMHAEFEERLFGKSDLSLVQLAKEGVGTVCFRRAVVVPNGYASVPFRCKMEANTKRPCIDCAGPKDESHPMVTFAKRVRATCGLEKRQKESNKTLVTLISRKPYIRWKGDKADKTFHRVLENEDELVEALESAGKDLSFEVQVVHLETMEICEQVEKAASSDILMGVHGAGLVHLWWLTKKDATLVELEPSSQVANPSFRTLSALTGQKYIAVRAEQGKSKIGTEPVRVDPNKVINEVRKTVNAKRQG